FNGFPYQHGGARSGSGRKKEEATKQIRVPVSLVDSLTALKNMYKGLDAQSKADLIEQINELIASKS
ncbi:hypothetical protein P7M35_24790, partial [Vibrio parahaemolyticus]|nr:hypothetical protein [Vibrio parahaemolyticus]